MSWFMKESPLVKKYKKYRDVGESINHQTLETCRMLHAHTSLFRIESIRQAENTLILSDLLTEQEPIRLIDISLSQTAAPDYLLFLRLIPLDDFTMSAGFGFVFPPGKEKFLLRQQKILMRKVQSEDTAVRRFVAFFKLNQRVGLGMGYT